MPRSRRGSRSPIIEQAFGCHGQHRNERRMPKYALIAPQRRARLLVLPVAVCGGQAEGHAYTHAGRGFVSRSG
jgi:hypothetical protein